VSREVTINPLHVVTHNKMKKERKLVSRLETDCKLAFEESRDTFNKRHQLTSLDSIRPAAPSYLSGAVLEDKEGNNRTASI